MRMFFGKKRCPFCGKKMKICFAKTPLTNEQKKEFEYLADVSGRPVFLNGEVRGCYAEMCLKCKNCGLVLNSPAYEKVRSKQKDKKTILLGDELDEITTNRNFIKSD